MTVHIVKVRIIIVEAGALAIAGIIAAIINAFTVLAPLAGPAHDLIGGCHERFNGAAGGRMRSSTVNRR